MPDELPLHALLSQVLVAFTIEFDNEVEHRMPHRTTSHGATGRSGPWLVSLAMWQNCLFHLPDGGLTVDEVGHLARTPTNLDGMRRWGYVTLEPPKGASPKARPGSSWMMRPTTAGQRARDLGREVLGEIEGGWTSRFGAAVIGGLRSALWDIAGRFEVELPDTLPILGHGLRNRGPEPAVPRSPGHEDPSGLPLSALLSRVLLSLAVEFEQASRLPIAVYADLVRVLAPGPLHVRDLPGRAGVSKEAVSMGLRALEETSLAVVAPDPAGSRFKAVSLTERGHTASSRGCRLVAGVEEQWRERYGAPAVNKLRSSLGPLVEGSPNPLLQGLRPYPDGWRAGQRPIETLPLFPMVLHRGGFPDGA